MKPVYKAHPWHGIPIGDQVPHFVNTFIEIVPSDTIKYEVDKDTGYLKIDRPQKYSNIIPSLYGFIPQTYCGRRVADLALENGAQNVKIGDGDPLDICVLSSHHIPHGDILLQARPIGGLCLVDKLEADDKIIAVLVGDHIYGKYQDLSELPDEVIHRLNHYFLTYKNLPDEPKQCEIAYDYGVEHAGKVIKASMEDYRDLIFKPM
ncbi:inorganic pyrophosphatase [Marinilongibacter aquaticus]|uniref:inorganic pyrophosphatase n=1 Tax=Marinilongibacter aquaticus TaxID=2975157 RepID=UPI0021BDB8F4|nr:inorganic pyrophosphatase [Marinilongibacter aquaticus]UBM59273.1 inorganic pyrophosphatase [Marinilongibacter aquaticus]